MQGNFISFFSRAFLRCAFQWAIEPMVTSLDYCGIWLEPLALSLDPLFIQWLAYRPLIKCQTGAYNYYNVGLTVSSLSLFI